MSIPIALAQSLYHEPMVPYAYPHEEHLVVRLRVGAQLVERVEVIHFDKFRPFATRVATPATLFARENEFVSIYQAELEQPTKRYQYYFALHLAKATYWYSRSGLTETEPLDINEAFGIAYLGERDNYAPPEWAKGTVYYQIFPDRFYRGGNQSKARRKLADWDSVPTRTSQFGGNLRGITDKLDDLAALGAETLYLTPIFQAPSNHKYDTTDYFTIDPHFGTTKDLQDLVAACHKRGMRVILDAVFNHMGAKHPAFRDLLKHGAASRYNDWIYPKSWPLSLSARNYETFSYVPDMPKWRTATPEVEEYLCRVGEHWLEQAAIDGWRLDVADEVEHTFWKHFRARVKSHQPEALICGEVWQLATPWLGGDEFDTVMNYPFQRAVIDWLGTAKCDASVFYYRIEQLRAAYPEPVLPYLWNLLDSHDTKRLLTACNNDKRQALLASFLQFTFIGSPVLYYGDEVGMAGGEDPLCRGGMVWERERQDQLLLNHYKTLIGLRKTYPVLREGNLRPAFDQVSAQLYAFVRTMPAVNSGANSDVMVCFVNNDTADLSLPFSDQAIPQGQYECVYGAAKGQQRSTGQDLALPAKSAALWRLSHS